MMGIDVMTKDFKDGYLACIADIINDVKANVKDNEKITKELLLEKLVDLYCVRSTELDEEVSEVENGNDD